MMAKILLLILGMSYDQVSLPLAQQFDTPAACNEAANSVEFLDYLRVLVVCVDSATGQLTYLRVKQR